MVKAKYGSSRLVKVAPYKRGPQPRIRGKFSHKKVVSGYMRRAQYWGPPGDLPLTPILEVGRRFDIKILKRKVISIPADFQMIPIFHSYFRNVVDPEKRFVQLYEQSVSISKDGILIGMNLFQKRYINRVPSNSGALRKALIRSLARYKNAFPTTVKWGSAWGKKKLPYASIVDRYTNSKVQIKHFPGTYHSGRTHRHLYTVKTGDLHAVYHFFEKLHKPFQDCLIEGIHIAVAKSGMPRDIYNWFIKLERV